MIATRVSVVCLLVLAALGGFGQVTVRYGAGLTNATLARDELRADLGAARREINWDDVPDSLAAPNAFPADYFNTTAPRGVVFSTPGTGFQVSASAASGTPVRFGNINPTYPAIFDAFSPERLFTPLGSTVTDVRFYVPGTNIPATVRGFGAMFSDNDGTSAIQFFGPNGEDFGTAEVPIANEDVAFLGLVREDGLGISRVRITSGNIALGPNEGPGCGFPPCTIQDAAVLDDFIYAEPAALPASIPIPTASTVALCILGALLAFAAFLRLR